MFSLHSNKQSPIGLECSQLHDETTFYQEFIKDLQNCKEEVIIESPFITRERMKKLYPTLEALIRKKVKVYVITRDPKEHDFPYYEQSEAEIRRFEEIGIQTLLCIGNHHRKLAILDREILWEGSLNILSQSNSREIMRRIPGKEFAFQMFDFLELGKFL